MFNKIVIVPGSFDCLHSGHIELFKKASLEGKVVVILKGDKRLLKKKGKVLMPATDRKIILLAIKYVHDVIIYDSDLEDDDDFSEVLTTVHPDMWAIGETKEQCGEPQYLIDKAHSLGIKILYGVGGDRINSSSEILKKYATI